MARNIPLILLGDDGTLLSTIESQRGRVSVARSAHTFADALGYAHAGIARAILSVGLPQEVTASILHDLTELEVQLIVIAPAHMPLPDAVMSLNPETEPQHIPAALEKLLDGAEPDPLEPPQSPLQDTLNSPYGYDPGYSGTYGYDTQSLGDSAIHPASSGYGYEFDPASKTPEKFDDPLFPPQEWIYQGNGTAVQPHPEFHAETSVGNSMSAENPAFSAPENLGGATSASDAPYQNVPWQNIPEAEGRRGTIVTIWGTGGAPGRSTIALNLANCAASEGLRVCLVDADTYNPSLSPLLGLLDDYSGIAQICHLAERGQLNARSTEDTLSTLRVGKDYLDFLSGITRPERWPELRTHALQESLTWLARRYDVLVIDTAACLESDAHLGFAAAGPQRNGAAITALEAADHIVLLGNADIIGIPRVIRSYDQMREGSCALKETARVHIWLNKVRADAAGRDAERELAQTWQRFGPQNPLAGFLPYDRKTVDRAWMRGQTLLEYAPKSPLVTGLRRLYASLGVKAQY